MATHMDRVKDWIDGFAADVEAMRKLVESSAPAEARMAGAAALGYMVSRMDLVPDWETTVGILDDALVLRVAAARAIDKGLGDVGGEVLAAVARMANEAEVAEEFLGPDLYPRLKKHVEGLMLKAVRGRTPRLILDSARDRQALFAEVAEELRRLPPAPMSDPEAVERMLRENLKHKLA